MCLDWIYLAEDTGLLMDCCEHGNERLHFVEGSCLAERL
jgi:hypothetical protein